MNDSTQSYRLDYLPLCTIAGSDPTGGAGIQGDLRTFAAHGGHGSAVITALTIQDRAGLHALEPVSGARIRAQLDAALTAAPPAGIKTGMLATAAAVEAVGARLGAHAPQVPLVVDPVLGASAGGRLLEERALGLLARYLAPRATVLTPNRPEAARLLGRDRLAPGGEEEAGRALLGQGWAAVLLKGGHGEGPEVVDLLVTPEGSRRFARPRRALGSVHGTGCALAAALTARLARGESLAAAVEGATRYVDALLGLVEQSKAWLLPHLAVAPTWGPAGP